jgi:hypothetical protein
VHTHTCSPLVPPVPVSPQQRSRSCQEGMKEHTQRTRFRGGPPVPLTRLAQRARTAIAKTGGRDDPQTAITLSPSFLGNHGLPAFHCRVLSG